MSYLVPLIAVVFVVVVGCYLASVPQEEDHQYIVAILGLIVPLIIVAIGMEGLGRLEFSEFVHDPQHACSRYPLPLTAILRSQSWQLLENPAIRRSGALCPRYAGLPSEKVMASRKNGDDGDLLLFQEGPGAGDISA
ncbi:hypothetical protein Tco_0942801 [Tanacetum coccineum]